MAKSKAQTPQELYAARKRREEEEKTALLPPGLINQGNTCFMNSVLQGLIATQLLSDLIYFRPIPPDVQAHSKSPLQPRLSPLLVNGTKLAGPYKQEWIDSMPIGDVFVNVMLRAWDAQRNQRRENQTPRSLLGVLGRKYDQYLDFAQQDAHEFMRILIDAMRMEEFDVIKIRQPPPPPTHKKGSKHASEPVDDDEKLISLSDMLFGGKLTSILVCQKCKHVSQTYEDFNDLSLSIKPEDYAKERKRDRLKNLAKRLTAFPSSPPPHPPITLTVQEPGPRSSSAPPSTPRETPEMHGFYDPPTNHDERRLSFELLPTPSEPLAEVPSSEKHLEFVDPPKPDKKEKDGWGNLGRRLSMSLGKGGKDRRSRSRERRGSRDLARMETPDPPPRPQTPSIHVSQPSTDGIHSPQPRHAILSTTPTPASSRPSSRRRSADRSRSPKPPKPSRAETEYLRKILADVGPSSSNPFARMGAPALSDQSMWFKMSQMPGIEDCLKMFTGVEILDGDNQVGCRRCWKIANGLYKPKADQEDSDSLDSGPTISVKDDPSPDPSPISLPTSLSSPDLSSYATKGADISLVSLPTTIAGTTVNGSRHVSAPINMATKANFLPSISTTAPPTPENSPPATIRTPSLHSQDSHTAPSTDTHDITSSKDTLLSAPVDRHRQSLDSSDESSSSEEDVTDSESTSRSPTKRRPKPTIMRPAYKRYLIATPPPVLVVHLKRFQQLSKTPVLSFSSGFKKLDDYVTFPEILDLTPFLAPKKGDFVKKGLKRDREKCLYRLYAVVVHIGSMLGGHYIAYTALPKPTPVDEDALKTPTVAAPSAGRQWAYISDTVVRLTTLEEVLKAKAYLCMYERI